jgi:putative membrane protein
MRIIINWFLAAAIVLVVAYVLPGVTVASLWVALVTALMLGLINAILRPLLLILTLPVNILTLGLLTFVLDALLVLLAARLVEGFSVSSFWWALLFALVLSLVNSLVKSAGRE